MRLSLAFTAFWLATALGQNMGPCTREMARTDGCAAVINPNACYNQFRFRNAQTLQCIEGADDNEKAQRACECCSCVGEQMCSWASQMGLCTG